MSSLPRAIIPPDCCLGKVAHPNRDDALRHVRRLILARKSRAHEMTAYYCRHCRHWHVGHAVTRPEREERKRSAADRRPRGWREMAEREE